MIYPGRDCLYWIVFTDGTSVRRTVVEATNLAQAQERAASIAHGMMDEHEPQDCNWAKWRITLQTEGGDQCEQPFPTPSRPPGLLQFIN
jgi:hypothetical protein